MTKREALWRLLRDHPCSTPRALAKVAGISPASMRSALRQLALRGSAIHEGRTRQSVWTATDLRPKDMRGKTEGNARGRAYGSNRPFHDMRPAMAAREMIRSLGLVPSKRRHGVVRRGKDSLFVGKIALEECWGFGTLTNGDASPCANDAYNDRKPRRGALDVGIAESEEAA